MKVLWTHNFDPAVENAGVFLRPHLDAMRQRGVTVDVVYTGDLRSPSGLLRAMERIRVLAKDYDVVHSQYGSACAVVTAAVDRPRVLTLRGSDWHRYRALPASLWVHSLLANRFSRAALRRVDAVVTVSRRIQREVIASGFRGPTAVIPSPVDLEAFVPADRHEARRTVFGEVSEAPWILFTTLTEANPIKRARLARQVVERVRRHDERVELKVASGLPHEAMPLFVACCDVVLCTSRYEGWPNSIKEGLACGLPFVATDVSDLAELAAEHGSCFVGPPDPDQLAQGVLRALQAGRGPHLRASVVDMAPAHGAEALLALYGRVA